MRLVLPIAPGWMLQVIAVLSLFTAVYAAGMAAVQRETRRFFSHLLLSHSSLVLLGLALGTELTLTASLCLWFSVIVSLGGFGLTLRAVEARFGRISLSDYHGLYEHTPALAVCFLLTGLASVGFPGTLGFISTELLVDSAVEASPYVGVIVVAAATLNGIAVMRAYFLIFTGAPRFDCLPGNPLARARGGSVALGRDPRRRAVPSTRRRHPATRRRRDPRRSPPTLAPGKTRSSRRNRQGARERRTRERPALVARSIQIRHVRSKAAGTRPVPSAKGSRHAPCAVRNIKSARHRVATHAQASSWPGRSARAFDR